jgi:putative spermidine/putrescine transport system substrate-binding protein
MKMSARKPAIAVSAATALLVLAACGGSSSGDSGLKASDLGGSPEAGVVKAGALKGQSVQFVGYGGEIQEGQMKSLKAWATTSGAKITEDSPPDYAKLQAQVKSNKGSWDVVDVEDSWAAANCGTLLMKLDDSIVDRSQLPKDNQGDDCSVPFVATGNIFAYNADKLKTAPQTWNDFFDTKAFPGKRALYAGNPVAIFEAALMADGVDAADLYPLDVKRAFKKLDTIKSSLVFWTTGAQAQQMVESGQADMGIFWSGRVLGGVKAGANWKPVHDRPLLQYDVLVVPKSAPNPIAAMSLINFALGKTASEEGTQRTGYPGTNINAKPKLEPVVAEFQANVAPFKDPVTIDSTYWGKNVADYIDQWTTWING